MKVVLAYQPSPSHLDALQAAAPQAEIQPALSIGDAAGLIEDADAYLGNRYFLQSLPRAKHLLWMQSNSVGMDLILSAGDALSGLTLTCARGIYDAEVAEHAVALASALFRGIHLARDRQLRGEWTRPGRLPVMDGGQAMVLGWGGVGRAIGARLGALGMKVIGVRAHPPAGASIDQPAILGPGTWRDALPGTDLLILALPLTPRTRHLVGRSELGRLPGGAFVVNVGRGGTLDEAALLEALAGRLGGAALDVFEHEPLPPGDPLWAARKVLITPHSGRSSERAPFRWEPLFVENLGRFARGDPLRNVVDQRAGY